MLPVFQLRIPPATTWTPACPPCTSQLRTVSVPGSWMESCAPSGAELLQTTQFWREAIRPATPPPCCVATLPTTVQLRSTLTVLEPGMLLKHTPPPIGAELPAIQ